MKNLLIILILFFSSNVAATDACKERIEKIIPPTFPTSIGANHSIMKGPCTVMLTYTITASGEVTNLLSSVELERCRYFKHSAERAIRSSIFKTGKEICDCKYRYEFTLDEHT